MLGPLVLLWRTECGACWMLPLTLRRSWTLSLSIVCRLRLGWVHTQVSGCAFLITAQCTFLCLVAVVLVYVQVRVCVQDFASKHPVNGNSLQFTSFRFGRGGQ